jgi:hypothetical protein
MKHVLSALLASSAMSFAVGAYAADASSEVKATVDHKKNGGYEAKESVSTTTGVGTDVKATRSVDVDVDSKGRVDKKVKVEKATDPKGLMNAKKSAIESEYEEKSDGGYEKKTTESSTDHEGSDVTAKSSTDVDVDSDGNVTSTSKVKKTVDPKGLLNSQTRTTTVKKVNGTVVEKEVK